MIVVLDAGPLGMVTNPRANEQARLCKEWLQTLLQNRIPVYVPEIADYEIRRELLLRGSKKSIERLNELGDAIGYLPITTSVMHKAAELWADARLRGHPTADRKSLDADVILAAQALTMHNVDPDEVLVATTNVAHLSRYVNAREWLGIHPA